jgi:hypothetical protein
MPGAKELSERVNELTKRLTDEIEDRRRWKGFDFLFSQAIAWVSIIASAATTILTAIGWADGDVKNKAILASLAALPGIMVTVESGFRFSVRSRVNAITLYDLRVISAELDGGADPLDIEKKFAARMTKMEGDLPSGAAVPSG